MADRDEDAFDGELPDRAGLHVAQDDPGDDALPDVPHLVDDGVERERNLRVRPRLVLHDLRRAEGVAAVDDGHVGRELRQEGRLFHRRVAAADDRDRLAAEEVAVAGRAGRHAVPHQHPLGFESQQPRRRARGENQRARLVRAAGRDDAEGRPLQVERRHVALHDLGAEPLRLRPHPGDQLRPQDAVAKAGVVLHVGGQHQLPARLQPFDEQRLQVGARGVQGGGQSRRPRPDDDHLSHERLLPP